MEAEKGRIYFHSFGCIMTYSLRQGKTVIANAVEIEYKK